MRNRIFAVAFILFSITRFASAQTQSAPASTPTVESTTADFNAAMMGKDWPHAVSLAQQLVQMKPSSHNIYLLGNAQLYSGTSVDALATYEKALSTAASEKQAQASH